jgi:alkylation response protein AidB-like acyl-CoA dehydrogenase
VPVRDGDHYVVNGQKTWNTLGQYADWIFCLVRTSTEGRQQEGISFLLIDMKTPGITVRPIIMMDGEHEINEVWFEDVRVPVENLIGEENKGWTYAKFLLGHERTGIAGVGRSKRELKKLKAIARREPSDGKPLIEDQRFRDRIAQVELELMALEITNLRVISAEGEKKRAPGPEASILKIKGSEIQQMLTELQMQALGHYALPYMHEASMPPGPATLDGRVCRRRRPLVRPLLQCPQDHHLRRLQRNPEEHHLADDSRPVRTPMDFNYTEEQLALQDTLRRFIAKDYGFEHRRAMAKSADGFDRAAWKTFADFGILALPFPEDVGGLDGNAVDTMLVMEMLGRGLALEPYLSTVVLCGGLIRDAGSAAQKDALLPQLAAGELMLALAHFEPGPLRARPGRHHGHRQCRPAGSWTAARPWSSPRLRPTGSSFPHATASASRCFWSTPRPGRPPAQLPDAGWRPCRRHRSRLVQVGPDALLGPAGGALPLIERAVDQANAALCAEAVGIMAALNEVTLEYLKTRKQFGVPIGKFQALQHRMADMVIATEQARSMAILAAVRADSTDADERRRAVAAAKAYVLQSARLVGQQAVQLHGGMGVTDELNVGHYFKRLTMIGLTFGDVDYHLGRFSDTCWRPDRGRDNQPPRPRLPALRSPRCRSPDHPPALRRAQPGDLQRRARHGAGHGRREVRPAQPQGGRARTELRRPARKHDPRGRRSAESLLRSRLHRRRPRLRARRHAVAGNPDPGRLLAVQGCQRRHRRLSLPHHRQRQRHPSLRQRGAEGRSTSARC